MGSRVCSGFMMLFGFCCSGDFVATGMIPCSGCSVDFVDKLWENLRESLWGSRWKKMDGFVEKKVLHINVRGIPHFGVSCGKIFKRFAHGNNRGRCGVLHVLHNAYYYNY